MAVAALVCLANGSVEAQNSGSAMLVDFNTPGQYTNNFGSHHNGTGQNSGTYGEFDNIGVSGSRGLDGIRGTGDDNTSTFVTDVYDFSQHGKKLNISMMFKSTCPLVLFFICFVLTNSFIL